MMASCFIVHHLKILLELSHLVQNIIEERPWDLDRVLTQINHSYSLLSENARELEVGESVVDVNC
jgi:hypothetical protein